MAPLQRLLHAAAHIVFNFKPHDHVTPALQELHWLPVIVSIQKQAMFADTEDTAWTHARLHCRPADTCSCYSSTVITISVTSWQSQCAVDIRHISNRVLGSRATQLD